MSGDVELLKYIIFNGRPAQNMNDDGLAQSIRSEIGERPYLPAFWFEELRYKSHEGCMHSHNFHLRVHIDLI